MQFLYPYVLWGFFAVSIPVIIHLFRLRRFKTVLFSNTKLLRDVQLETRRKSRIKHLIILLLRMLTIISLVLAFSRPFIPRSDSAADAQAQKTVVVYVDNSFSMEAGESYHSLLNVAKSKTLEIMNGFSSSDRFLLLSNTPDAASFRPLTPRQFESKLADLRISSYSNDFSTTLLRFSEISAQFPESPITAFVISDFQRNFLGDMEIADFSKFPVYLVPIEGSPVNNAGIDSVWLDSPVLQAGRPVLVNVRVRNYSGEAYSSLPVELFVNGSRRSVTSCDLSPGGEAIVEMSFTPDQGGNYECYVQIQDSPIIYDNTMYFAFTISEAVRILAITGKNQVNNSIQALFRKDPLFTFTQTNVSQLQFGKTGEADMVILDAVETPGSGLIQEIETFVRQGGTLVVIPPAKDNGGDLNMLMNKLGVDNYGQISPAGLRISELNTGHELFRGVFDGMPKNMDLPTVKKYLPFSETGLNWRLPLMKMQNGMPFLVMSAVDEGIVYYFCCPFDKDFTDFHQHAIVVPVFYQMAFLSRRLSQLYYVIGRNEQIVFSGESKNTARGNTLRIVSEDQSVNFIPRVRTEGNRTYMYMENMIDSAGTYLIADEGIPLQGIAFNYLRDESLMEFYKTGQIDSILRINNIKNVEILDATVSLTADIQSLMQGSQLWKIFLLGALLFLAIEVILLRFWK
jgi:hypothetical protein